ncbi:MAG: bis(5'-nucleosyl)-tetraphosphatase (symmetrical) YqeK [Candidatus Margulisiibacteriota bacterium]|jgi:nicotinate-nucleotide adenylyltransferase
MIENLLKQYLSSKRINHSYLVAETAKSLALHWQYNKKLSYEAGLLHDITKELTPTDLESLQINLTPNLKKIHSEFPQIFHAFSAPYFLPKVYQCNAKILNAIKWHTTGKAALTKLEKIIFIADYIEPDRKFLTKDYITDLAYNNLNEAILAINIASLIYLINRGIKIYPKLIECHNYYLAQLPSEKIKIITKNVLEISKNEH